MEAFLRKRKLLWYFWKFLMHAHSGLFYSLVSLEQKKRRQHALRGSSGTSCGGRYLWLSSRGNLPQTNTRIFVCVGSKIGKTWHTHTHTRAHTRCKRPLVCFFFCFWSPPCRWINSDYEPRRVLFKLKKLACSWLIQAVQLLSCLLARKHTVYIYILV